MRCTSVVLALVFTACSGSGPLPRCDTGELPPLEQGCPADWAAARRACDERRWCPTLHSCWYPGVGDILRDARGRDCGADGLASCGSGADGGLQWQCAQ